MKYTLSTTEAAHKLKNDSNAAWSYAGAFALVEYLEEMEADTGEEIEFDPCALRCEFTEYFDLVDWADMFWRTRDERDAALGLEAEMEVEDVLKLIRDFIRDRGTLIEFDEGIIVSDF